MRAIRCPYSYCNNIKKTAHREILKGGTRDLSCGIAEVQGSHTSTLVALSEADAEILTGLSKALLVGAEGFEPPTPSV